MSGSPWNNIKKGATSLLMKVKNNHKNLKKCRVTVIIFASNAAVTYSKDIHGEELDPDQMFKFTSGGTNFEYAFTKAYEVLRQQFTNYMNTKIIFFTDGYGGHPTQSIENICSFIKDKRQTLEISLYCNTKDNLEMAGVNDRFNKERPGICDLELDVDDSQFESKIIEVFRL